MDVDNWITSAVVLDDTNRPIAQMRFERGQEIALVMQRDAWASRALIMWANKHETGIRIQRPVKSGDRVVLNARPAETRQ